MNHADAHAEALRRPHTPTSLGKRVGIPERNARLVLTDLVNRGELLELVPGFYGSGLSALRPLVLPLVLVLVVAVVGIVAVLAF